MRRLAHRPGFRGGLLAGIGVAVAVLSGGAGPSAAAAGPVADPSSAAAALPLRRVEAAPAAPAILAQDRRAPREGRDRGKERDETRARDPGRAIPFIDTHMHVLGQTRRGDDFAGAGGVAVAIMDRFNVIRSIVMPPPFVAGKEGVHDHEELLAMARRQEGRFSVLGGGGSLNVMIHEAVARGAVDDALKARFAARAERILADGAVGFGELAPLHFSLRDGHPFMMAPPDHPLFLLLAEIAARRRVPVDLHMEAVAADRDVPDRIRGAPNADRIPANIPAFERLLGHAPGAVVIWDHLGWDNTGERTVGLSRRLLAAHPNLVMNIKAARASTPLNQLLRRDGGLDPDWRALILEFPDRFLLGSDIKPTPPGARAASSESPDGVSRLLDFLPPDVAQKIAVENPSRIFRLE